MKERKIRKSLRFLARSHRCRRTVSGHRLSSLFVCSHPPDGRSLTRSQRIVGIFSAHSLEVILWRMRIRRVLDGCERNLRIAPLSKTRFLRSELSRGKFFVDDFVIDDRSWIVRRPRCLFLTDVTRGSNNFVSSKEGFFPAFGSTKIHPRIVVVKRDREISTLSIDPSIRRVRTSRTNLVDFRKTTRKIEK